MLPVNTRSALGIPKACTVYKSGPKTISGGNTIWMMHPALSGTGTTNSSLYVAALCTSVVSGLATVPVIRPGFVAWRVPVPWSITPRLLSKVDTKIPPAGVIDTGLFTPTMMKDIMAPAGEA